MSVSNINGNNGKYDGKVTDSSVRYGRNAVENHLTYLEKPLANDNFATPPILEFNSSPDAQQRNIDKLDEFTYQNDVYLNSLPPKMPPCSLTACSVTEVKERTSWWEQNLALPIITAPLTLTKAH